MTLEIIMLVAFAAFLTLILLEVPVGLAIALSGILGVALQTGMPVADRVLATTPYSGSAKYSLVVIPMYILLGTLIANSGLGAGIYRAVNRVVVRLPGGLAVAAVTATALFSGISGSSAADVATFGRISVNEMTRHGYSKSYAAAVVAAAGTFAALIPPSVTLVIYAIIAEQSIAAMIVAGIVPGGASAVCLASFLVVRAWTGPSEMGGRRGAGPVAASMATALEEARVGASQRTGARGSSGRSSPSLDDPNEKMLRRRANRADAMSVVYAGVIFLIVVGGLYGGVFTATESGAMGAFAAAVIGLVAHRSRTTISLRELLRSSLHETASVTSMIFLLLIGGAIFSYFVASSGMPRALMTWTATLDVPPMMVVALFLVVLLVLGMFLDGLSMLVLTVPLIAPVVEGLGFDGVWFGILVLKTIEIGLITPPVGINAFIISGIVNVPVVQVFKRLVPFVILDLAVTAAFFAFPDLILWLPRLAGLQP